MVTQLLPRFLEGRRRCTRQMLNIIQPSNVFCVCTWSVLLEFLGNLACSTNRRDSMSGCFLLFIYGFYK